MRSSLKYKFMNYPTNPNDISVLMETDDQNSGRLPWSLRHGIQRPQNSITSKLNAASSNLAAARRPLQGNAVKSFDELAAALESGAPVTVGNVTGSVQMIELEDGSRKSWNVRVLGMVRGNDGKVAQGTTTVHVKFA